MKIKYDDHYSSAERSEMLAKMREASNQFYTAAVQTGCHSFIEFTGLMNEFINLCEAANVAGNDFTQSNVHLQGVTLPMREHHAAYLGEKLGCIFASSFAKNPELFRIFLSAFKEG